MMDEKKIKNIQDGGLYDEILQQAVAEIKSARNNIARQVNATAIGVYWNIGKLLSERKIEKGHGAGVVNRLSIDLKAEFPEMGLSSRNLWEMKRFYERYKQADPKLQQAVAVLPWGHNILLLNKINANDEAYWYAKKSIELGWSRNILLNYLKADSYHNEIDLPKSHNFKKVLPEILAEQAEDMLKASYNLAFLGLTKSVKERELEQRLSSSIFNQSCFDFNRLTAYC